MSYYLLTLLESQAEHEHVTKHLIEAKNRQMVKYHYHRTLKKWGYADRSGYDTHCLEGNRGLWSDIHSIESLYQEEYRVLKKYISNWTKV